MQALHLKGSFPSEAVQGGVQKLVKERGELGALAELGISRQTLARLAGGLSVQRATLAVVKMRLGITGE